MRNEALPPRRPQGDHIVRRAFYFCAAVTVGVALVAAIIMAPADFEGMLAILISMF